MFRILRGMVSKFASPQSRAKVGCEGVFEGGGKKDLKGGCKKRLRGLKGGFKRLQI